MAYCTFMGRCVDGSDVWGDWMCSDKMSDELVKFCKDALGDKYRDMWVYPVYFDDAYIQYTEQFFSEVGVILYPRRTSFKEYFETHNITMPTSDEEWAEYRAIAYNIVYSDLFENELEGVSPIYIIIRGERIKKKGEHEAIEKIRSVERVKELPIDVGEWSRIYKL